MKDNPHYFRLGLFVVMGAAILVAGIFVFAGGQLFRHKVMFETYVDGSVQGVDVGTPVKFRGVKIGRVTGVNFTFNVYEHDQPNQNTNYVVLFMEVDRPIAPHMLEGNLHPALEENIAKGLRVRIEPQGITGMNYLDFGYVNPSRFPPLKVAWKPHYLYVPYAPGELTSFLDSINKIMVQLEDFNLEDLTNKADALLTNLNKAVLEAKVGKVREDIEQLIARTETTLTEVQAKLSQADVQLIRKQTEKLLHTLQASATRLDEIMVNLEPATKLNPQEVHSIIANATAVSENLLQLSEEVKKKPSLLLWGTPGSSESTAPSGQSNEDKRPSRQMNGPRGIPGNGPSVR